MKKINLILILLLSLSFSAISHAGDDNRLEERRAAIKILKENCAGVITRANYAVSIASSSQGKLTAAERESRIEGNIGVTGMSLLTCLGEAKLRRHCKIYKDTAQQLIENFAFGLELVIDAEQNNSRCNYLK